MSDYPGLPLTLCLGMNLPSKPSDRQEKSVICNKKIKMFIFAFINLPHIGQALCSNNLSGYVFTLKAF